mgnify:CR=1 FL=1
MTIGTCAPRVGLLIALGAALLLPACGTTYATMTNSAGEEVMLLGHDPVAYFTMSKSMRGDPAIKLEHKGVVYRFASEANKAEFQRAPEKYMPQFGGFCSNGINYAVPWGGGGGPNTWRIYRGKLYVFGGQSSRDEFEIDTENNLLLVKGSVPGPNGGLVLVRNAVKAKKAGS